MEFLKDRRVILLGGAGLALGAGLAAAVAMAMRQDDADGPPPASQSGLMVQMGRDDTKPLDAARPLRCFVNGRLVGELTVGDCARRNGVATGALDVGVDSSGGLAAAAQPTSTLAPQPPVAPAEAAQPQLAEVTASIPAGERTCWSYGGGAWSRDPSDMSLDACVQSLFAGQCVRPGGATYGRWGDRTLRLVLGRVEISAGGTAFRLLARQQGGCEIPTLQ
jgi:hypothetical protein